MRRSLLHRARPGRDLARWARGLASRDADAASPFGVRRVGDLLQLGAADPPARSVQRDELTRLRARLRSLQRLLSQHDEVSARRIAELETEITELHERILDAEVVTAGRDLDPLRSAYRTVQGLDERDPLAVLKRHLLYAVFAQNMTLLGRRPEL